MSAPPVLSTRAPDAPASAVDLPFAVCSSSDEVTPSVDAEEEDGVAKKGWATTSHLLITLRFSTHPRREVGDFEFDEYKLTDEETERPPTFESKAVKEDFEKALALLLKPQLVDTCSEWDDEDNNGNIITGVDLMIPRSHLKMAIERAKKLGMKARVVIRRD